MGIYSIAVRTANMTISQTSITMVTSSTVRATIFENGLTIAFANASTYGLGHPGAGTTLGTTSNGQPEDLAGPSSPTQVGTTWTTQPTAPANYLRRTNLPATVGAGIIWTFPRGITIPVSNSMCIYNISAVSNSDIWYVWDE